MTEDKYGSSPIVFMDEENKKEWEKLSKKDKDFIFKHLAYTADKLCNKTAIEMLCHVVNELISRVEKLEKSRE